MTDLADIFISQMVNSLNPTKIILTRELKFLAFLICKNLSELCETGSAILHDLESKRYNLKDLPDHGTLSLCRQILQRFYSDKMFIDDENYGARPNWDIVTSFDTHKADTAFRIYQAIKNNVLNSKEIQNAIHKRDKHFFIKNYSIIFQDMPFQQSLDKFKNFLIVDFINKEHLEYVWNFFESLLDIFLNEKENIKDLQTM